MSESECAPYRYNRRLEYRKSLTETLLVHGRKESGPARHNSKVPRQAVGIIDLRWPKPAVIGTLDMSSSSGNGTSEQQNMAKLVSRLGA